MLSEDERSPEALAGDYKVILDGMVSAMNSQVNDDESADTIEAPPRRSKPEVASKRKRLGSRRSSGNQSSESLVVTLQVSDPAAPEL